MKRTLAIIALVFGIALFGAFACALAQSSGAQADKPAMSSCPMMSKGMMGSMMNDAQCPMMKGDSQMAGQCMQMMMSNEKHRGAMVEMFRKNPELREQMKRMLEESER